MSYKYVIVGRCVFKSISVTLLRKQTVKSKLSDSRTGYSKIILFRLRKFRLPLCIMLRQAGATKRRQRKQRAEMANKPLPGSREALEARAKELDLGNIRTTRFDFNVPFLVSKINKEAENVIRLGDILLGDTWNVVPDKQCWDQAERIRYIHGLGMQNAAKMAENYVEMSMAFSSDEVNIDNLKNF